MIFENIDESEVLCNQLAMDVAQVFCQNYSELEEKFYIHWAGNPNDPTSGRALPYVNTVFKAPTNDMYPQIYLFVLERISPFLLNGEGNTKTKIASLRSLLERGLLGHVEQVVYQCHGVDGEGKVVTSEFATQTAQTCVEMIKKIIVERRKRNDDTSEEAIFEAKTTLKKTRESWKLDISSLLGVMGQEINQSLLCAQQAVDVLQKAQRMGRDGLGIEEEPPKTEQPVEVEVSSTPLSAENLKRREKVEASNGWGSQGEQSTP